MKDILGYEGIYQISDDYTNVIRLPYDVEQDGRWGKYKRHFNKKECKITLDSEGYQKVNLSGENVRLHRIIWECEHGKIPEGMVIDHINRNKSDNRLENLRLVEYSTNIMNAMPAYRPNITKRKNRNKYQLRFSMFGKRKTIGDFNSYEEAEAKYKELYNKRIEEYKKVGIINKLSL